MITAKEAKQLAQESESNVNNFIERLSVEIRKAAEEGKYEYLYTGGLLGDPTRSGVYGVHEAFETPRFWKLVIEKLKAYPQSFNVDMYKSEPRMPGGLAATEDSQPYVCYGFRIRW